MRVIKQQLQQEVQMQMDRDKRTGWVQTCGTRSFGSGLVLHTRAPCPQSIQQALWKNDGPCLCLKRAGVSSLWPLTWRLACSRSCSCCQLWCTHMAPLAADPCSQWGNAGSCGARTSQGTKRHRKQQV